MRPEVRLEMIHMQLTRACNLNCWFCGQRKSNRHVLADSQSSAMKLQDWMAVIEQLKEYGPHSDRRPSVMIWGGEALLAECFVPVTEALQKAGFPLGMVTNGTLLHRHIELYREAFEKIYISVDGPEALHDSIRGNGTFQKIKENIRRLRQSGNSPVIILMTVVTSELLNQLPALKETYQELAPDAVLLQDMIGLKKEEVLSYQRLMHHKFQIPAPGIEAWEWSGSEIEEHQMRALEQWLLTIDLPFPVSHIPHRETGGHCLSPFRHIHIMWNGEVSFCTDFTDFSAGNVKQEKLADIFGGEAADWFRKEIQEDNCVTCNHCSWRGKTDYSIT